MPETKDDPAAAWDRVNRRLAQAFQHMINPEVEESKAEDEMAGAIEDLTQTMKREDVVEWVKANVSPERLERIQARIQAFTPVPKAKTLRQVAPGLVAAILQRKPS